MPGHENVLYDLLVTMQACLFRHAAVTFFDSNRIREDSGREGERVPEPIIGFDNVFPDQVVWRMTVVADSDRSVARFDPGIKVILHDVAIHAGFWIVSEV